MAKIDLKFIDCCDSKSYIKTEILETGDSELKTIITISGLSDGEDEFSVWLDKSTAIKFAKTLRTEINKITESEVNNG